MTTKRTHVITHPDGSTSTRKSDRVYTHAVVVHNGWGEFAATPYIAVAWSQSAAGAEKAARTWSTVAARNGGAIVSVEEVGA